MTKEQELAMQKILITTSYPCIRVTPYMKFSNGTTGSVLVVNFDADVPYLLLFNSPERADGEENCDYGYLLMAEADLFIKYRKECLKRKDDEFCMSKEAYDKYGVALLTGSYMSAYIADIYCERMNITNPYRYWRTGRVSELLSKSVSNYTLPDLEDDVDYYLSEESTWRRTIVSETLFLHSKERRFLDEMKKELQEARNIYVDWLERGDITFKLYFAQQALNAYHDNKEHLDWRKLLEEESQKQREKTYSFRYSDYNIQQIIGLYSICKHLYTNKPKKVEICYKPVEAKERVPIYEEYTQACTREMYDVLCKEEDPLRTQLPTESEAREKAKLRMAEIIGKEPEGLPDVLKETYAKYEEGFCKDIMGLSYINTYTYDPKKPLDSKQPQVNPTSSISPNTTNRSKEQAYEKPRYPHERNYNDVVDWLEKEKKEGRNYYAEAGNNRSNMCRIISPIVGWEVNENSLRKAQKRRLYQ